MTAPQPSRNARLMTLRFVPGGPEPITNGFGNFNPSTVVASVGIKFFRRERLGYCSGKSKLDRFFAFDRQFCFAIQSIAFDASRSKVATASSRYSSLVSS